MRRRGQNFQWKQFPVQTVSNKNLYIMNDSRLKVTIPQGTLIGTTYVSDLIETECYAFLGIPYAKPPIGKLRFRAPELPDKWIGTYKADKQGSTCIQFTLSERKIVGSEDCLYMNVFVPEPPCEVQNPYPVIVNIHGGANFWGSGNIEDFGAPDFALYNKDIVFVNFNYRLCIFGYLNLNMPECAGNMGLKDQVMALRWIKDNIQFFGGDPENITLYGASAGGTNIHLHMLSHVSRGLFHRVILQGGYITNPVWSLTKTPIDTALEVGHLMDFKGNNLKKLLRFLKSKTDVEIIEAIVRLRMLIRQRQRARYDIAPFRPTIETVQEGAFLNRPIKELFDDIAPVPIICSFSEYEGSLQFTSWEHILKNKIDIPETINEFIQNYKMSPRTLNEVSKKVQSFYFGDTDFKKSVVKSAELYTDLFLYDWYEIFNRHSRIAPVYMFLFTFNGAINYKGDGLLPAACKALTSTCHGDDHVYFLCCRNSYVKFFKKYEFNEPEKRTVSIMTKMFSNYARTGNPNNELMADMNWEPHTEENPSYLIFGETLRTAKGFIFEKRSRFWEEMLDYIRKNECIEEQ